METQLLQKSASIAAYVNATLTYRYDQGRFCIMWIPGIWSRKWRHKYICERSQFINDNEIYCLFDEEEVSANVLSDSELSCLAPARFSGTSVFSLKTLGGIYGTSSPIDGFIYTHVPALQVESISPTVGPTLGSTRVVFTGVGFRNTSQLSCVFGSSRASGQFISTTEIACKSPPTNEHGHVSLYVSLNGIDDELVYANFLYASKPNVSHVAPWRGPSDGATSVAIRGSGFVDSPHLACLFDGVSSTAVYIASDFVECKSPGGPVVNDVQRVVAFADTQESNIQIIEVKSLSEGQETQEIDIRADGTDEEVAYFREHTVLWK